VICIREANIVINIFTNKWVNVTKLLIRELRFAYIAEVVYFSEAKK